MGSCVFQVVFKLFILNVFARFLLPEILWTLVYVPKLRLCVLKIIEYLGFNMCCYYFCTDCM